MKQLPHHFFGYRVFRRIARTTTWHTVLHAVSEIVVNPIYAVVNKRTISVFWGANICRWRRAIKAWLRCNFDQLLKIEIKKQTSRLGVSLVVHKNRPLSVHAFGMSSARVSNVCSAPRLLRVTSARQSASCLEPAKSNLFLNPAIAPRGNKIMVSVLTISAGHIKDCQTAVSHAAILVACFLADWAKRSCFHGIKLYQLVGKRVPQCDQILRWDRFQGAPLRGLTLRRQAEHRQCLGAP